MSLPMVEDAVKVHLSLNVPDLGRAVAFYRTFFGVGPAKWHADYAKFELDDPPVVFSLAPHAAGPGNSLSHLGLRVGTDEAIAGFLDRLEAAGVCTQAQAGTTCGYAKQNKLWVTDPFGTFWEVYRIEEEVRPEAVRTAVDGANPAPACGPTAEPTAAVVWEHYVTAPPPDRIPHDDGSVDEVRLVGTFNSSLTDSQCDALVAEAARVLKPGGKVLTHGLMADRPFPAGPPTLPGLAAMCSRVPVQSEPLEAFRRAGFVGAQVVKYTEQPWFAHDGVGLREVKLVAWKPSDAEGEPRVMLYKGPFARATADGGHVFPRGQRVTVPAAVWDHLRHGAAADQFLFFEPGRGTSCPTT